MDPIKNPFSPGAGSPPPELVGRDPILEQARILLGRIKAGRPEKSMLLTGLRGVGKTVLLNDIERMAKAGGSRRTCERSSMTWTGQPVQATRQSGGWLCSAALSAHSN
jgi:hypothetical protein